MYKTLIVDLDGTLLNSDKAVSEKNKQAIKDCVDAGINVSIASGRPPSDVYPFVDILNLHDFYHVADNGATIFKHGTANVHNYKLDKETYKSIIKTLRENNIDFGVLSPEADYCVHEGAKIFDLAKEIMPEIQMENIGPEGVDAIKDAYKVAACCESEDQHYLIRELEEKHPVDAFHVGENFFDIMPKGVNKFIGVKAIEKQTGISTDDMLAIGDYENDKDILKNIGFGICMKNGLDSVKEVADVVLDKTNDEDAVAHVIDKYILRRI